MYNFIEKLKPEMKFVICVGTEVLTQVSMKSAASWDISCSPVEVHRRFGGTYCFHLQGRSVSRARKRM
jgi:hypothetical protein